MRRFKHPFTLVELLCVIIVLALLAALTIKVTQIAYRRADETKTKTVMEIVRAANEQYKAKKGYYLPNSSSACSVVDVNGVKYYKIKFVDSEFTEFLGDAYETLKNMPCADSSNKDYIRDAWGKELRYSSPGVHNTGSYDLYSKGRDTTSGDGTKSFHNPGEGDDIANFIP